MGKGLLTTCLSNRCLHPGAIVREQPNVALPHVSVARGCHQVGPGIGTHNLDMKSYTHEN